MGEIKQTNFRINSETADMFRAFCEKNGMNQAQGFDHIMDILAMNQAKELISERLVEIEEFEQHTKAILNGYLRSLETAKNTEIRVRENFENDLIKKDKRIAELEEKIDSKTLAVKEAEARVEKVEAMQKQAEEAAEQARKLQEKAEKTAEDKKSMYEMSQSQLKEALEKLDGYPALKERNMALEKELEAVQHNIAENKKDAEIAQERAVSKLQAELAGMKASVVEKEKQLDKLESKNDVLQNTISELRSKVAELTAQNSFLEKQLDSQKNEK